jgi:site-specific DNA-methyltransferase (adenine-specific)
VDVKPYYQDEFVTLYHGDCRDVLPSLPDVDLVLTDPPYPKLKGNMKSRTGGGVGRRVVDQQTVGTPWGEDLEPLAIAWGKARFGALVFCSFHSVALVPAIVGADPIGLVTWYKRNSMPPVRNVPYFQTEFVWAFGKGGGLDWRKLRTHYDIPLLQAGCMATERFLNPDGSTAHPAQKPLALVLEMLAIGGDLILDPYAGTGTTLHAAKHLGRRAIGIEVNERYCELAVGRLRQGVLFGGAA